MATNETFTDNVWENPALQPFLISHVKVSDEKLGVPGAYGVAKKVKVNGMEFAAKIIHSCLIEVNSVVVDNYIRECKIISALSNANIVRFVGLCHLPKESKLPLLVMELMDHNLHSYLLDEINMNIPLHLRQSILTDVAKGLNYLHTLSDPIIHRDLTAMNVLLNSALVAKISDFGNSQFLPNDFNPKKLSKMPGAADYMPPEANGDEYTTKLDIFSFGHLALFTLTQIFPERLLEHTFKNEESKHRAGRSEVERRAHYFDILCCGLSAGENESADNHGDHPLTELVKKCLANEPTDRPTAEELVQRLEQKGYSKELTHVTKQLENKECELQQTKAKLQERNVELQRMKAELEDKSAQFQQANDELQVATAQLQQKCDEVQTLKQQVGEIVAQQPNSDDTIEQLQVLEEPPIHMSNHPQAVVIEDKVYIGGGYATPLQDAARILVYDSRRRSWSKLPKCPTKYFGLAATFDGKLAVVAGMEIATRTKTGLVYMLDPNSPQMEWEKFPCTSMHNFRSSLSVVSYRTWLIAVGGEGRDGKIIEAVEKLDTAPELEETKRHWSQCSKLATKSAHFTLSIVNDTLFAFCTKNKVPTLSVAIPSNAVFFARLDDLLASNQDTLQSDVWKELKDLPIMSSTAVAYQGSLLALGGIEKGSFKTVSTCIYKYSDENELKWVKVGDLPHPICQCASTEFQNKIFVYGKMSGITSGTCVYMYVLKN